MNSTYGIRWRFCTGAGDGPIAASQSFPRGLAGTHRSTQHPKAVIRHGLPPRLKFRGWVCASLNFPLCQSLGMAVLLDRDGRPVPPPEAAAGLPRGRGHLPHEAPPNGVQVSEAKSGSWERRSIAGGSISLCRATAPHFAQWVLTQYSPQRRKHGGRPRLTGMNCRV